MGVLNGLGDLESLVNRTKTLNNVMGQNNGHRMTPYYIRYNTLKEKNPSAAEHYQNFVSPSALTNNSIIPILRMPDNGINIYTFAFESVNKTYNCNLNLLLLQIEKLLLETKTIYRNR